MRTSLALIVLAGATSMSLAQSGNGPKTPRDEALYISNAQMHDIMKKAPGSFSTRLLADTTFSTAFIRLEKPDQPHAHGIWSETFYVVEGSGVVETGGTITGITGADSATHKNMFVNHDGQQLPAQTNSAAAPQTSAPRGAGRVSAPGDLAGTDIEGGHRQAVGPGDLILIPAGVAHRWVQVDKPVVYLDTKFPKAQ
jgi:mannose-6-phosphate isomerase-like protein (cupin superfamily)